MLPWKRSPSLRGVMAAERGRHFKPGFAGRPGHPHALHYVRRGGDKTPAIKQPPRRPSSNLTWRLSLTGGGWGGRGRAGERARCVKESHYSVMDCTCHTVSALFIPPKRRPCPLGAFPYPSEIYQVRAGGTWGTTLRAPGCC